MKKLMIAALAVVAFASVTEASNFLWKTKTGNFVYQSGTTAKLSGADCYIFAATGSGAVTQQTLLDAFAADSANFSLASQGTIDTKSTTTSTGAISAHTATFDYGTGGSNYDFYFATLATDAKGNKMLYLSDIQTGAAQEGSGTTTLQFQPTASSKLAAVNAKGATAAAGWYTAVPEPTSGLLLLLGVAGLALRRRRA